MGGRIKRKGKKDKATAQLFHARRRIRERYGIVLRVQEIRDLAARIHRSPRVPEPDRPAFIVRQSHRLTVWSLPCNGRDLIVVYDKLRNTIVTALPPRTGLPGGPPLKSLDWKRFEDQEEESHELRV